MRKADYFDLYTTALLGASAATLPDLGDLFGQRAELRELEKPGVTSIGGEGPNGEKLNFVEWLAALRAEGITDVRWALATDNHYYYVKITTTEGVRYYTGSFLLSSQYAMTGVQFAALLDAQDQPEVLWDEVFTEINEFNGMNGRETVGRSEIGTYLSSPAFKEHLVSIFSNLLSEVQVTCAVLGTPFRIPAALSDLLIQSSFRLPEVSGQREIVFFYQQGPMTAVQLLKLVNAQSFAEEVWEKMPEKVRYYPEFAGITVDSWPTFVSEPEARDLLDSIGNTVCLVIRELCEEKELQPAVPAELKDKVGPDEEEMKRIKARMGIENDQWFLADNKDYWELYLYRRIGDISEGADLGTTAIFGEELEKIAAFAKRIDSPFAEAFVLGTVFMEGTLPEGNFSEGHWRVVEKALTDRGLSERALENAKASFDFGPELQLLGWPAEKIWSFFAYTITDVFGGMGSWNDIVPDDPAQYAEMNTLNDRFYRARSLFWVELLSL